LASLDVVLREHAPSFVLRRDVEEALGEPATIGTALARTFRLRHSVEALTQVLRRLAAERVSIRNLRRIVEALCDFDYVVADADALIVFDQRLPVPTHPGSAWLADPQTQATFVRTRLKRQITHSALRGGAELPVYLLDADIERELAANRRPDARPPSDSRFGQHEQRALLRGLHEEITWSPSTRAPVILTTLDARGPLRELLADCWPQAMVLAYQDLLADTNIRPLGRIQFVH
jgi:type III secretory pathway component EscV